MVGAVSGHGFSRCNGQATAARLADMNLTKILGLIANRPDKRTAAELRATLAEIDQQALERKVDAIEAERRKLLLRGSDAELTAIMADLTAANLQCERAAAAADELKRLIGEAERREAAEQLEANGKQAREAADKLGEIYREVDAAAGRIKALLAEAGKHAGTVAGWNRQAEKHRLDGGALIAFTDPVVTRRKLHEAFK